MSVCYCTWCGQSFEGKRNDALFCSGGCKQKYWRWKHRLDLSRKILMNEIDAVADYLQHENTEHQASLVLGEMADRLAALGFVATEAQMSLPVEAFTLSNQLGEQNA
jgi:NTP pyrophosphatase (non-canonical NTP hydrolase)